MNTTIYTTFENGTSSVYHTGRNGTAVISNIYGNYSLELKSSLALPVYLESQNPSEKIYLVTLPAILLIIVLVTFLLIAAYMASRNRKRKSTKYKKKGFNI